MIRKYRPGEKFMVMSREQVRAFDAWAINIAGVPGAVLMENAGRAVAGLVQEMLVGIGHHRVVIFCGTGNNGGDGYVVARHLSNNGFAVRVVICGDPAKVKGDARVNLNIIRQMKLEIEKMAPDDGGQLAGRVSAVSTDADVLVDALFGTGLAGQLSPQFIELIESINRQHRAVVAVDIPSGLDCDTGEPLGAAIRATATVTFVAVKKGFTANPSACRYTGEIYVAPIGIEPRFWPGA
jgi:NAD(P)H-hydrate epimerase